jgi:hypothetical protein
MPELPDPRSVSAESLYLWRLLVVRAVVDFGMSQADAAAPYGVRYAFKGGRSWCGLPHRPCFLRTDCP